MAKKSKGKKDEIVDVSTSSLLGYYKKYSVKKPFVPLVEILMDKIKEEDHLSELVIPEQIGVEAIIDIFKALSSVKDISGLLGYKHLKSIRIWENHIGESGVTFIKNYIYDSRAVNIKLLELVKCGIEVNACQLITELLHPKDALDIQVITLDYNPIGNLGVENLMKNLAFNFNLTYLSLAYCGINADGVYHIKKMFDNQKNNLIYFSLEGNEIEAKGAMDLMNFITENSPLEEFNLQNTLIKSDSEFISSLTTMMNTNLNLGVYNLRGNHLTDEFLKAVNEVLQSHKEAKDLHIYQFLIPTNLSNELYEKFFSLMNGRKKPKKKKPKKAVSAKKK